jgi:ketosteroid isomerase-like protein
MASNIETVIKIYEAFGKGDIPGILSYLSDEVKWEEWNDNFAQKAGVPWLMGGSGKEAAVKFFKLIGAFRFNKFDVISLMEGKGQVAAEISFELEMPNGTVVRDEEIHLWTFNDKGMVIRFRHYLDTAKHISVAKE